MIDKKFMDKLIVEALNSGISRYVVAAVITNKRSEVLLLQRPKDEFYGGIYELPSGKVEDDESLEEALYREVKEETGLNVKNITRYLGHFDYLSKSKKPTRQFNFHVEVEDVSQIILKEHSSYVWVSPKDLHRYPVTEEVRKILEKFWQSEK